MFYVGVVPGERQRAGVGLLTAFPTLTYGHQLWVVTERMTLQIQATKMSFLLRMAGLRLRNRWKSLDLEMLRVELQLLRVEMSQLSWFGIWSGCLLYVFLGRCFGHAHLGADHMPERLYLLAG